MPQGPVIAAVHGACVGAGVDLVTACDIRYATADAFFQIKEVDIGLAADVGTLQRFPRVVGNDSLTRELCYTARKMAADEALSCGLVSKSTGATSKEIQNFVIFCPIWFKFGPVVNFMMRHHDAA